MWLSQAQAGDRHFENNCVRGAGGLFPVCPSTGSNRSRINCHSRNLNCRNPRERTVHVDSRDSDQEGEIINNHLSTALAVSFLARCTCPVTHNVAVVTSRVLAFSRRCTD